jgi:D-tyrosyl-tRNA(Tyr) deacylase
MIALIQRVTGAHVEVDGQTVGRIGPGLLALVCAERGDTLRQVASLLARVLAYRVFADASGRMNQSLRDTGGGLLLVPQFTLAADTRSGLRPSFTPAAPPGPARELFEAFADQARAAHAVVQTGVFGADMKVHLVNDGPVTFWLRVDPEPDPAQASHAS